jgi:hypothetical protein
MPAQRLPALGDILVLADLIPAMLHGAKLLPRNPSPSQDANLKTCKLGI